MSSSKGTLGLLIIVPIVVAIAVHYYSEAVDLPPSFLDWLRPLTDKASAAAPQDGPAQSFKEDVFVKGLADAEKPPSDDEFGIVLTTCWPAPSETLRTPYQRDFLPLIRSCFDDSDETALYLYPSQYLHVTVATLHSFTLQTRTDRDQIQARWRDIVVKASQRPGWPTAPLNLRVASSQIGTRAGILLWDETTGGVEQMRDCIRAEAQQADGIDLSTLKIPKIVHSTFLRFRSVPQTPAAVVQERFSRLVEPKLKQLFAAPIVFEAARLVNTRTAYMHIPNDEEHVLETFLIAS